MDDEEEKKDEEATNREEIQSKSIQVVSQMVGPEMG